MIGAYLQHQAECEKIGIPPLPLSPQQTAALCQLPAAPSSPASVAGLRRPST